jgi:heterodisulfide reductase subunit A-like polyferredoxin
VVGAGIAGLTVANELARTGVEVAVIERNPYPGGRAVFYGCKAGDECVHCGVCLVREAVADFRGEHSLSAYFSTTPVGFAARGDGSFEVDIETRANPIDWKACVECGRCVSACPEQAIERAPGWTYFVNERCTSCGKCVEICPTQAIRFDREAQRSTLEADGVVVATGFAPFDPAINRKWGYGSSPRVVTGSDMERLFFEERYLPLEARSVAFVQCVGSRNVMEGQAHCSQACCPYALRMAGRMKSEFPQLEIDFYHMDIQQFGKSFDRFWGDVRRKINLIPGSPISVKQDAEGRPIVRYEELPGMNSREKSYDLVVLSNGICPQSDADRVAELFALNLTEGGFVAAAGAGSRSPGAFGSGVFAAGTCRQPMRIDGCVADASAVSARVLKHVGIRV